MLIQSSPLLKEIVLLPIQFIEMLADVPDNRLLAIRLFSQSSSLLLPLRHSWKRSALLLPQLLVNLLLSCLDVAALSDQNPTVTTKCGFGILDDLPGIA